MKTYAEICPQMNQSGKGCLRCGIAIPPGRRKWCSPECMNWWHGNHRYLVARGLALQRAEVFAFPRCRDDHGRYKTRRLHQHSLGYACSRCGGIYPARQSRARRGGVPCVQVNHIVPAMGLHAAIDCVHHQDNLEVLCVPCHQAVTLSQGAARRAPA